MIDISRFKVVYGDRILNAVAIGDAVIAWENRKTIEKFVELEVIAINEDGNLVSIKDETWRFQFIPIVNKKN